IVGLRDPLAALHQILLVDELEALVEPEGTGFTRDALRRPVGVEHAESGAAGALSGAGGSEERCASRARDCKSLIHSFSSFNLQARAGPFGTRARATNARLQPYATEPSESGERRGGARRRARIERGFELRLGEKLPDRPGGGHRAEEGGRGARNRGAALGIEGAQGAMRGLDAFSG